MRFLLLYSLMIVGETVCAQGIMTPANTPLSIKSDLNLMANKAIQIDGVDYLKLPSAGGSNVTLGLGAGAANLSGTQNLFLGTDAGFYNNATANVFVGYRSGYFNTTGTFNTFLGVQAGANNISGGSNVMIGTNAGAGNTTGSGNFFVGDNAGGVNTSGNYNVYLGINAGNGLNVNGNNNTAIGFGAGGDNDGGAMNLFLGYKANASAGRLSNATAIGPNASVGVSNAVVLGNNANVGIGTSAPTAKLDVVSSSTGASGLKLSNLTSRYVPTGNASKFLTVDTLGNVVLANVANGAKLNVDESGFWGRRGSLVALKQTTGVVIGADINHTPAGYNLYVGQGILTEKVKVAIKSSADWSDRVFEPGYSLRPLSDVTRFIRQHGHLPGVPSAHEVVSQGIDLGRMDATLLEKIEELTLYTIKLEEDRQKQQFELDELKQQVKQLLESR